MSDEGNSDSSRRVRFNEPIVLASDIHRRQVMHQSYRPATPYTAPQHLQTPVVLSPEPSPSPPPLIPFPPATVTANTWAAARGLSPDPNPPFIPSPLLTYTPAPVFGPSSSAPFDSAATASPPENEEIFIPPPPDSFASYLRQTPTTALPPGTPSIPDPEAQTSSRAPPNTPLPPQPSVFPSYLCRRVCLFKAILFGQQMLPSSHLPHSQSVTRLPQQHPRSEQIIPWWNHFTMSLGHFPVLPLTLIEIRHQLDGKITTFLGQARISKNFSGIEQRFLTRITVSAVPSSNLAHPSRGDPRQYATLPNEPPFIPPGLQRYQNNATGPNFVDHPPPIPTPATRPSVTTPRPARSPPRNNANDNTNTEETPAPTGWRRGQVMDGMTLEQRRDFNRNRKPVHVPRLPTESSHSEDTSSEEMTEESTRQQGPRHEPTREAEYPRRRPVEATPTTQHIGVQNHYRPPLAPVQPPYLNGYAAQRYQHTPTPFGHPMGSSLSSPLSLWRLPHDTLSNHYETTRPGYFTQLAYANMHHSGGLVSHMHVPVPHPGREPRPDSHVRRRKRSRNNENVAPGQRRIRQRRTPHGRDDYYFPTGAYTTKVPMPYVSGDLYFPIKSTYGRPYPDSKFRYDAAGYDFDFPRRYEPVYGCDLSASAVKPKKECFLFKMFPCCRRIRRYFKSAGDRY
ncbi:hypothetical protein D9613_008093 [Agrocybe pediades]|uniref:Uncharacterized protein n=1 Tax=Agrocybe pediades TaxID=84607 RepID=A0A8H4QNB9_9AGAR|nr:hypothetical protein D9613_008093 [Agrocybe pediades]